MAVGRKQLVRLIRLVAQLKENRYPNCSTFAAELRQLDLEENLNVSCTAKTVARDIAAEAGCYKLMLLTGAKDEATLNFYRRAGYNSADKTAFIQWL